jgi:hypothetical protein
MSQAVVADLTMPSDTIFPWEETRAGMRDAECACGSSSVYEECHECGADLCSACAVRCSLCKGAVFCANCVRWRKPFTEVAGAFVCEDCPTDEAPSPEN